MSNAHEPLVSCDWLAEHRNTQDLVILDATFFLPNQGRHAEREYLAEHLPGARFFDIDVIADRRSALPHMLPSREFFAEAVGNFGIGNTTHVVVYDNNSFMASARVWWMFRVFGHDRVSVLDGGLMQWKLSQQPLETGVGDAVQCRRFVAGYRPELVRNLGEISAMLGHPGVRIIDARSPGRFAGTDPEPRPGVRPGHIPGSTNVFYRSLVDGASGLMKSPASIEAAFRSAGLDPDHPMVASCGTGVTAAILALALFRLGREGVPVYDGSWTEWGGRDDTPVETGP